MPARPERQRRVQAGVPTGGQFAGRIHAESTVELLPDVASAADLALYAEALETLDDDIAVPLTSAVSEEASRAESDRYRVWLNESIVAQRPELSELAAALGEPPFLTDEDLTILRGPSPLSGVLDSNEKFHVDPGCRHVRSPGAQEVTLDDNQLAAMAPQYRGGSTPVTACRDCSELLIAWGAFYEERSLWSAARAEAAGVLWTLANSDDVPIDGHAAMWRATEDLSTKLRGRLHPHRQESIAEVFGGISRAVAQQAERSGLRKAVEFEAAMWVGAKHRASTSEGDIAEDFRSIAAAVEAAVPVADIEEFVVAERSGIFGRNATRDRVAAAVRTVVTDAIDIHRDGRLESRDSSQYRRHRASRLIDQDSSSLGRRLAAVAGVEYSVPTDLERSELWPMYRYEVAASNPNQPNLDWVMRKLTHRPGHPSHRRWWGVT